MTHGLYQECPIVLAINAISQPKRNAGIATGVRRSMDEDPCKRDDDLHDAAYLRGRARDLRAAAASARDPEIAHALRQVAGDFDSEASREEAQLHGPPAAQRAAADS